VTLEGLPIGALGTLPTSPSATTFAGLRAVHAVREIQPGKLHFASMARTGAPHDGLYTRAAGLDIVHVPYQGSGPAIPTSWAIGAGRHRTCRWCAHQGRQVRARDHRQALGDLFELPTFAEVGLPAFEMSGTWGSSGRPAYPRTAWRAQARAIKDPRCGADRARHRPRRRHGWSTRQF
jgi:tripartite-type tricarboxylate transporter receptor subunit TctC